MLREGSKTRGTAVLPRSLRDIEVISWRLREADQPRLVMNALHNHDRFRPGPGVLSLFRLVLSVTLLCVAIPAQVIPIAGANEGVFRSREDLVPENAMEIRGMGSAYRDLTPVLRRSYEEIAYVDTEELYRRQVAAIERGVVNDTPLPIVSHEGRGKRHTPASFVKAAPRIEREEQTSSAWTIGISVALLAMLGLLIRHSRRT